MIRAGTFQKVAVGANYSRTGLQAVATSTGTLSSLNGLKPSHPPAGPRYASEHVVLALHVMLIVVATAQLIAASDGANSFLMQVQDVPNDYKWTKTGRWGRTVISSPATSVTPKRTHNLIKNLWYNNGRCASKTCGSLQIWKLPRCLIDLLMIMPDPE
jgi:hypothetical protein